MLLLERRMFMKKNSIIIIIIILVVGISVLLLNTKKEKNNEENNSIFVNGYEKYYCKAEYELTSSTNHKYKNTWNYKFEAENDIENNKTKITFGELSLIYKFDDIVGYNEHKQSNFHINGVEDISENDEVNLTKTYKYVYIIDIPDKDKLTLKEYIDYLTARDYKCIKIEGFEDK